MRASSFIAPLFFAATSLAQGVEEGIAPSSSAPDGCDTTVDGNFTIGTLKIASQTKRETAQEAADGVLSCTLVDGILHDQYGRTGSVVANHQFQFDGPPQAGAIYTGGFSICKNDSLAIGGTTRWWQCNSGAFNNLYDEWIGDQCDEIRIQVGFESTSSSSSATPSATSSEFTGVVSTLSATQTGLTTSHSTNATASSGSSTGSSSPTASSSGATASGSASSTGAAAAPPAQTGAATPTYIATGSILGAIVAIFCAALSL